MFGTTISTNHPGYNQGSFLILRKIIKWFANSLSMINMFSAWSYLFPVCKFMPSDIDFEYIVPKGCTIPNLINLNKENKNGCIQVWKMWRDEGRQMQTEKMSRMCWNRDHAETGGEEILRLRMRMQEIKFLWTKKVPPGKPGRGFFYYFQNIINFC